MPQNKDLILAFDTSAAQCAVALLCGEEIRGKSVEPMSKGQAERLVPLLEETLAAAGKQWSDLDRIAVCVGPGNFTGVRIAVSAARALALALNIPAIGISVFEALAFGSKGEMRVSIDGRRNQIFWQDFVDGKAVGEPSIDTIEDLEGVHGPNSPFVDPVKLAKCAQDKEPARRPAPLYLRPADAALPSDPPPEILP